MKRSNVNKFHRERVRSRARGCNLNKSKLDLQNENTSRGWTETLGIEKVNVRAKERERTFELAEILVENPK